MIVLSFLFVTSCTTFDERAVLQVGDETVEFEYRETDLYVRELCNGSERRYGSGIPSLKALIESSRIELAGKGANALAKAEIHLYARQYKLASIYGRLNLRLCWRITGYPVYVSPPEE